MYIRNVNELFEYQNSAYMCLSLLHICTLQSFHYASTNIFLLLQFRQEHAESPWQNKQASSALHLKAFNKSFHACLQFLFRQQNALAVPMDKALKKQREFRSVYVVQSRQEGSFGTQPEVVFHQEFRFEQKEPPLHCRNGQHDCRTMYIHIDPPTDNCSVRLKRSITETFCCDSGKQIL